MIAASSPLCLSQRHRLHSGVTRGRQPGSPRTGALSSSIVRGSTLLRRTARTQEPNRALEARVPGVRLHLAAYPLGVRGAGWQGQRARNRTADSRQRRGPPCCGEGRIRLDASTAGTRQS